jgi:hypothetical protein
MAKDSSIINWELYMKVRDAKRIINEEIARSKAESFAKINKARLREIIREEVQKLLKETA